MKYDKLEKLMASLRKVEVFSAAKQNMLLGELTDWNSKEYSENVDGLKRAKQEIFDLFQAK
jgi:hypothetical protein